MRLKRLVTSINASFDDFVAGVENHEAVAAGAIADVRKAAARLRVQKGQLEARISRQQNELKGLAARRDRWQQRAAKFALDDPDQGLRCLRERDATDTALDQLRAQMTEQSQLAAEISKSLTQVETRLGELQNRRTALASRGARANVMAKVATPSLNTDIDELFERWEVAVLQDEYRDTGASMPLADFDSAHTDELDRTMQNDERDIELKAELDALQKAQTDRTPDEPKNETNRELKP